MLLLHFGIEIYVSFYRKHIWNLDQWFNMNNNFKIWWDFLKEIINVNLKLNQTIQCIDYPLLQPKSDFLMNMQFVHTEVLGDMRSLSNIFFSLNLSLLPCCMPSSGKINIISFIFKSIIFYCTCTCVYHDNF